MMFRLSKKLSAKIKVPVIETLALHPDPLCDWSGHLFTVDRKQLVLLTNTATLYSLVFPGRGISNAATFCEQADQSIREALVKEGLSVELPVFDAATVRFSKALNRTVTGCMTEFVKESEFLMLERGVSLNELAWRLNETPVATLRYDHPRQALTLLIESRIGDSD